MDDHRIHTIVPRLRFPDFLNDGEWEVKLLGEIADYENGIAHENDIDSDGDFIIVNSKFISSDGQIKKRTNVPRCLAQKDDVLMVLSDLPNGRALAKCFYVAENNLYTVNQRICKFHPKNVHSKLLYYLVNRNEYFLSFDDGVKQTNLKKGDVLNCPLIIPKSIEEQDFIATCLTSLDELLSATNEKLEQMKAYKKGLMQKLFPAKGKKQPELRFKEFEKDGEWEVKKLGEIITTLSPTKKLQSGKYKAVGSFPIVDQSQNYICGYSDDVEAVVNTTSENLIVFGDHTCTLKFVDFPFIQGADGIKIFKSSKSNEIDERFLYQALLYNPIVSKEYKRHFSELKEQVVCYPKDMNEQCKIASCLSSMDDQINAYLEKVALLEQYKKGLMQQMFPTSK